MHLKYKFLYFYLLLNLYFWFLGIIRVWVLVEQFKLWIFNVFLTQHCIENNERTT